MSVSDWYLENLACPRDRGTLRMVEGRLMCSRGHLYPIVSGIPVMLIEELTPTLHVMGSSLEASKRQFDPGPEEMFLETLGVDDHQRKAILEDARKANNAIDPVVNYLISHTNGMMYRHLVGRLRAYPIPSIELPRVKGARFLDVGCSWGRWCVASARLGYLPVGLDPSLGAVMAAQRVAKHLGVTAWFVVGDARFLPFPDDSFGVVYSYSVLQHFNLDDMRMATAEMHRVLAANGTFRIQLANALGIRSLYHQLRRGFSKPKGFAVRYLRPKQIKCLFQPYGSDVELMPDCYFGLGLQTSDSEFMTPFKRFVLRASEVLKRAAAIFRPLPLLADSLLVSGIKM